MSKSLTATRQGPPESTETDAVSESVCGMPKADQATPATPSSNSAEDIIESIDKLLSDQLAVPHFAPAPTAETATVEHPSGDDQWRRQFLSALRNVDSSIGAQTTSPRDDARDETDSAPDVFALPGPDARALPVPYAHKDSQDIAPLDRSHRIAETLASTSRLITQHRHLALTAGTGAALTGVFLAAIPQIASLSAPAMPAIYPTETASAVAQGTVASHPPMINAPVLVREGTSGTQPLDAFAFAPGYMAPRSIQSIRVEEPARMLAPAPIPPSANTRVEVSSEQPSVPATSLDHARLSDLVSQTPETPVGAVAVSPDPHRAASIAHERASRTSSSEHRAARHEKPTSSKPAAKSAAASGTQWNTSRQGLRTTPPPEPSTLAKLFGAVWPPSWPSSNPSATQEMPQTAPAAAPTNPVYSWSDVDRPEP